jgi:hypothetical protein
MFSDPFDPRKCRFACAVKENRDNHGIRENYSKEICLIQTDKSRSLYVMLSASAFARFEYSSLP